METGPLKAVMKKVVKGGEKTEKGEERAAKGRSAGSGGKSNDSNDNTESGVKPIFKSIPDRLAKRYMRCAEEEHHQASCPYSDDTIARWMMNAAEFRNACRGQVGCFLPPPLHRRPALFRKKLILIIGKELKAETLCKKTL
mmetsp:Transcript_39266/g.77250  ORF Transcript_39266/g.77250 Transcript_39266/m.77250 type:complete len:141 (+) Transcript_39266:738-1160(+)